MSYTPGAAPFVDNTQSSEVASKLLESKKLIDWLPKLDHRNNAVSTSFTATIAKDLKYGLKNAYEADMFTAISRCSINSRRSLLAGQVSMQIGVPGFFDKGSSENKVKRGKENDNP